MFYEIYKKILVLLKDEMKELYSKYLIEMRKDSGYNNTKLNIDSYKFVRFV